MKVLYSVQRYGSDIVGGSETACREYAEHLVKRGHEVTVLTSCAKNYENWRNDYSTGDSIINGVKVHRLSVAAPQDSDFFHTLHPWMMQHHGSATLNQQSEWAQQIGPQLEGHEAWLAANVRNFDVAVFMTYLYTTTTTGLPLVAGIVPTILQPTSHDEPDAYVSLFQTMFRQPDAFLFFTEEEKALVQRIYNIDPVGDVAGIGVDTTQPLGNAERFRSKYKLGGAPYLIYVGRLDERKGVGELVAYFTAMKKRKPTDLRLVLVGDGSFDADDYQDVVRVGFLNDEEKRDAIAGSIALVQPSHFESFSIVLCEAWLQKRVALVQGGSTVLRGQAMRSGGAIPYEGFAEFETSVEFVMANPESCQELGKNGHAFVSGMYNWDLVLDKFQETARIARDRFAERRSSLEK